MTAAITVVDAGLHTTVQDLGRFGHQAQGVPVAGALDPASLRLLNTLLGNNPATAGLELLHYGPTLLVNADSVRVAAAGAAIEILDGGQPEIPAWQSARLERGRMFRLGTLQHSACGYLAIEGGLALKPVMGSLSTYTRSGIGGFDGRVLRRGDALPLVLEEVAARQEFRLNDPPNTTPPARIRTVLGPQQEYFTKAALDAFLNRSFSVSNDADRMGLRLDGPGLNHSLGYNIISDGIATGAIQVPGSGQPILLLADHQTAGGYPKIATVISADLPAVGRLKPGDPIRFSSVTVAAAENLARDFERDLQRRAGDRVAATAIATLDERALFSANLISGVFDAKD